MNGPFKSLRDYMVALEERGAVIHLGDVDQDHYEGTAFIYRLIDQYGWNDAPAVVFDRVKIDGEWLDGPVITNQYGNFAFEPLAWGVRSDAVDAIGHYSAAIQYLSALAGRDGKWQPVDPVPVSPDEAPCKTIRLSGDAIDVNRFPFIQSNPADGGRYINTGAIVIEDPELGRNVSVYRCQIKGPRKICVSSGPGQDGYDMLMRAKQRGEPFAHAAIALGIDPISYAMAGSKTAAKGQDELALAGAFLGEPVQIVKCETSDICVPASAEMVIEGRVFFEDEPEGPFGEGLGYMGPARADAFYMEIDALTHRPEPWFCNQFTGATRGALSAAGEVAATLGFKALHPQITGVYFPSHMVGWCIVSINKTAAGQGIEAAGPVAQYVPNAKITVVVDDDVEIHKPEAVMAAMAARWQPARASKMIEEARGLPLDPSISIRRNDQVFGSKIIIDATRQFPDEGGPAEFSPLNRQCLADHDPDIFAHVDARWAEHLVRR